MVNNFYLFYCSYYCCFLLDDNAVLMANAGIVEILLKVIDEYSKVNGKSSNPFLWFCACTNIS